MEDGNPVITEVQLGLIKRNAALLGEDGDAIIQDIQTEAEKDGRLPADIFKIIESCCQDLNKRVVSLEMSNELVRERETERLAQVEAMREQVARYNGARAKGDNAALVRIKPTLYGLIGKYVADVNKDKEDGLASDVAQRWKDQAYQILNEALIFFGNFVTPPSQGTVWPPSGRLSRLQPILQRLWLRRSRILVRKGCETSPGSWGRQRKR